MAIKDSKNFLKKWITEDKLSDLVSDWIQNDILRPIPQSEVKFIIPLNPVKGANTKSTKIRLAMDYSDLNQFLVSTTSVETNEDCLQQLRLWRLRGNGAVIDLSKAYLSIDLDMQQWPYHCVKFRGNFYCMTRLAFGVSNGPRVLFRALEKILKDHDLLVYRDDLLVDDAVVAEIESVLSQNGFNTKPPERIGPGTETAGGQTVRALGLSVKANEWRRTEQNTDDWRLSTEYDDKELKAWYNFYASCIRSDTDPKGALRSFLALYEGSKVDEYLDAELLFHTCFLVAMILTNLQPEDNMIDWPFHKVRSASNGSIPTNALQLAMLPLDTPEYTFASRMVRPLIQRSNA
jgi:hypothetical protein